MTLQETQKVLLLISSVYQNFQISEATPIVWQRIFEGFEYSDVEGACFEFFRSPEKFPPAPGQLIEILRERIERELPSAVDAWSEVLAHCSNVRAINLSEVDPMILQAMRGVGWERVAYADIDKELPWLEKRFRELYEQEVQNATRAGTAERLSLLRQQAMALPATSNDERAIESRQGGEILRRVFSAAAEAKNKNQAEKIKGAA